MINKRIILLIAILAVTIPISASAIIESWIDYDCDSLTKGMIPICNDVNDLNFRITNLENTHITIPDLKWHTNFPINTPYLIENFTANVNDVDWTDKITLSVLAPNQTTIHLGSQPFTLIPDRNGNWNIKATIEDSIGWDGFSVTDGETPPRTILLSIIQIDDGDYLQINATGFYPSDPVEWQIREPVWVGDIIIIGEQGSLSVITVDLKLFISEETDIEVLLMDKPTNTKSYESITYGGN